MRHGSVVLLVAVGVALAASTAVRVHRWTDERSLWAEAVARSTSNPRAWSNLGRLEALAGRTDLAIDNYRRSIAEAQAPRRSSYDRIAVRAYAEANLSLLEMDHGDQNTARVLMALAVTRLPEDVALQRMAAWITATD